MAVGGIFAKTDVGDYEERREASAKEADSLYDGTLRVIGFGTERIFRVGGDGDAEEYYGSETLADKRFEEWDEFFDAAAMLAGK